MTNDGHGTTTPKKTETLKYGTALAINATPASGYEFLGWSLTSGTATLGGKSTSASNTVKLLRGNATLKANFKAKAIPSFILTMTNDGHGTTTPKKTETLKYGTALAINATPASGYEFLGWSLTSGTATLGGKSTSASNTVKLLSGNATLKANFKARIKNAKSASLSEVSSSEPTEYALYQNYPNPFNPSTRIAFAIPSSASDIDQTQSSVVLNVYDMKGQLVKNLVQEPVTGGAYSVTWDGKSNAGKQVASGQYLCKIISGNFTKEIRMTFMK
ncbi:MAG: FlgD immunoglobulin-like domain containing protein [Fibrobacterota bacterium]